MSNCVASGAVFVLILFKAVYNKTIVITGFGFCDILNNLGLGKYFQPRPSARLITLTLSVVRRKGEENLKGKCFDLFFFKSLNQFIQCIEASLEN